MLLERVVIDDYAYWVLRDDKGIAAMAESREAILPKIGASGIPRQRRHAFG